MRGDSFYEDNAPEYRLVTGRVITYPPHLHRDLELFYVAEGENAVTVEGRTALMRSGEACVIWPNRVHGYESGHDGAFILAIIQPQVLSDYRRTLEEFTCDQPFLKREDVHPDVRACLTKLTSGEAMSRPLTRAYLTIAAGRLMEKAPLTPARDAPGGEPLHDVLLHINRHISEPLSLDRLARDLFLDKFRISKLFSQRLGMGFSAYLARSRVSLACDMIGQGEDSVERVIEACGFGSERTFYRQFTAISGMTPKQAVAEARAGQSPRRFTEPFRPDRPGERGPLSPPARTAPP